MTGTVAVPDGDEGQQNKLLLPLVLFGIGATFMAGSIWVYMRPLNNQQAGIIWNGTIWDLEGDWHWCPQILQR